MFSTMHPVDFAAPRHRVTSWDFTAHLDALAVTRRDMLLLEQARAGRAAIQYADRERVREMLAPVRDSIDGQRALLDAVRARVA